jgi:hypothetical protein
MEPIERVLLTDREIALSNVGKWVFISGACTTIIFGVLHLVG